MKKLIIAITLLLVVLLSPFAQADVEKIIPVSAQRGMTVGQFYTNNKNYRNTYTKDSFLVKFCALNPQFFKKCSLNEYRHLPAGKTWYFPALPEASNGKTIKQVYQNNEVYRIIFSSFSKFQQEVCKNNPEKITRCDKLVLKNIRINEGLKTTSLPETYLIFGEKSHSITIGEKTFTKTNGGYYRVSKQNINQTQKGSANTKEEMVTKNMKQKTGRRQDSST